MPRVFVFSPSSSSRVVQVAGKVARYNVFEPRDTGKVRDTLTSGGPSSHSDSFLKELPSRSTWKGAASSHSEDNVRPRDKNGSPNSTWK